MSPSPDLKFCCVQIFIFTLKIKNLDVSRFSISLWEKKIRTCPDFDFSLKNKNIWRSLIFDKVFDQKIFDQFFFVNPILLGHNFHIWHFCKVPVELPDRILSNCGRARDVFTRTCAWELHEHAHEAFMSTNAHESFMSMLMEASRAQYWSAMDTIYNMGQDKKGPNLCHLSCKKPTHPR